MIEHELHGCKSQPVASYLKGLGILRILSEQKDSTSKMRWHGQSLWLRSALNKDQLASFFCEQYAPTPVVSPWNGSSGFSPTTSSVGMSQIVKSSSGRLSDYRLVIAEVKSWDLIPNPPKLVDDLLIQLNQILSLMRDGKKKTEITEVFNKIATTNLSVIGSNDFRSVNIEKIESLKKGKTKEQKKSISDWSRWIKKGRTKCLEAQRSQDKEKIFRHARNVLPDSAVLWLDSVYSVNRSGRALFSPLLGTGGNDAKLDLSKIFMDSVATLFLNNDRVDALELFQHSVYDKMVSGLPFGRVGMYDPGRAGGPNQGSEIKTEEFRVNPWDYVLMIEGSLVLASSMACRNLIKAQDEFTAPFTVDFSPVGFVSNDYKEGGSEVWLPIWPNWASFKELKQIFGEGRSSIGKRSARRGTDFSVAIGNFGVDRGITAFERFLFVENRRGKCQAAIPAGRMPVKYRPNIEILEELDPILLATDRFIKTLKGQKQWDRVPVSLLNSRRNLDQTIINFSRQPDAQGYQTVLKALGRLERFFATRDRSLTPKLHGPLFGLSTRWVSASDDGCIEIRIAAALSSLGVVGKVGPLRSYISPIDPSAPWKWSREPKPDLWKGSNLAGKLSVVFYRRIMDSGRHLLDFPPLKGVFGISSRDVMLFLLGDCDDSLIEDLLWGLTLVDYRETRKNDRQEWKTPITRVPISRTWALFKTLYAPDKVRRTAIKLEPRIPALVRSGRVTEACRAAIRRLDIHGLRPFDVDYQEDLDPTRLLASLLIPVRDQKALEKMILDDDHEENATGGSDV